MSVCTIRFTDRVAEPASDGWRVSVELPNAPTHEAAGMQVSITYPFDTNIEKDIRWHLETYPDTKPWEVGVGSKIQKLVVEYAIGIFRQIPVLHEIGRAPGVDSIVIDVIETGFASSNIHELHWEALENPVVWDELWALHYPPQAFRKPKPIPKVTVRRTIYVADPSFHDCGMDSFDLDDLSLSDNGESIVQSSFKQVHESDGRRSIVKEQAAEYNMVFSEMQVHQKLDVSISFFRILLVVARSIDTEKYRKPPSTGHRSLMFDIDPFLISEPLLDAISNLPKDLDVRLEVCRPGSWDALERTLRGKERGYYDLVHFDMHGAVLDKEGTVLYFLSSETNPRRKEFGTTIPEPAAKVGALLYEAGIVMVALNACETAREEPIMDPESRNERHPNDPRNDQSAEEVLSTSDIQTNLAKVLVKCGIPSVLAMSYVVIPSFVTIFYNSFYKALLQSKSDVAEAVATARQALLSQKQRAVGYGLSVELADWIIPVLYQSHDVTFTLASPDITGPDPLPHHKTNETTFGRKKLLHRLLPKNSNAQKTIETTFGRKKLLRRLFPKNSNAQKSTNRMLGRGLEVLRVEALLLNTKSRRTLCLAGKPGIGKTHFVNGLAEYWFRTGCISNKALYIDCFDHLDWRAMDVLREIVREIVGLGISAETIEIAQDTLRSSKMLVILDNVEEKNLSLKPEDKKAKHNMQSFIQSLDGGQSVMIIVSRSELQGRPRLLSEKTRGFIEFWQLSERDQLAIQEVTLDILRQMGKTIRLGSKYETRNLRRVLQCLEHNPLIIKLFLQTMSKAGLLSNMKDALHSILFGTVPLPLDGPDSRMVCAAHKAYTELGSVANGQDLQKLALCLCYFNNVIPCSLDEKVFFPSATCYLAHLMVYLALPWPSTVDPSIVSKDPLQLRTQLDQLSREPVNSFCVLMKHFLDADLVHFTSQDQLDRTSREAIDTWKDSSARVGPTRTLLSKLKYLRINPVLTHYLRGQVEPQISTKGDEILRPHGINPLTVQVAYCSYFKSFSKRSMEEHDSRHQTASPQISRTNSQAEISASDVVFSNDAPNFYSAAHTAIAMQHPKLRWELTPIWALLDLASKCMRTFNPLVAYEPLRTGAFTEETILSMLRLVVAYYDSAPRGERDSHTPLEYAARCSHVECCLMSSIGGSEYSDIEVYHRQIRGRILSALSKQEKLRVLYGAPGAEPDTAELFLQGLLEDKVSERADERSFRRLIGDESWRKYLDERMVSSLYATAVRGGLPTKIVRRS